MVFFLLVFVFSFCFSFWYSKNFVGARVRRMAFANFQSTQIEQNQQLHTEVDLLCLTNLGDCLILSIPDLKRQLNAAAIKREDIK